MNTRDELASIRQRAARVWLCPEDCPLPECRTEQDRARLLGALDAVLALHSKRVTQAVFGDCAAEACDHEDTCPTEPFEVCTACWNAAENINSYFMEGQISSVAYPCATVRAINDALEAAK